MNPSPLGLRETLFAILLLTVVDAAAKDASWDSLLQNSPFQERSLARGESPDEPEFRGVMREGGVWVVSLYRPDTRASQWISVPGSGLGVEVESYNEMDETVVVLVRKHVLTIPLKNGHIVRTDTRDENEKQWRSPFDGRT